MRRLGEPMDDPQNQEEQDLSTYILDKGAIGLGMALLRETWRAPKRMFEALKVAFAMGRGSQAGVLRHLIYLAEAAVIAGMARENGYEHLHAHFGTNPAAVALRDEDITIAELLQDAGYATGHIGKWGLGEADGAAQAGLPRRQGFDYFWGYLNHWHAHNSWPTFIWRNEERVELRNVVPDEDNRGAGAATVKVDFIPRLTQDEAVSSDLKSVAA